MLIFLQSLGKSVPEAYCSLLFNRHLLSVFPHLLLFRHSLVSSTVMICLMFSGNISSGNCLVLTSLSLSEIFDLVTALC